MRIRTAIILLLIPFVIYSAGNNLSGIIIDKESGEPLAFANIFFEETDIGTTSNEDGYFSLSDIPLENGSLRVSMIGYETASNEVKFPMESPTKDTIRKISY